MEFAPSGERACLDSVRAEVAKSRSVPTAKRENPGSGVSRLRGLVDAAGAPETAAGSGCTGTTPRTQPPSSPMDENRQAAPAEAVTRLLQAWAAGCPGAQDELLPLVYNELRRRAAGQLRRDRKAHTLQPTALVHEAYLRLLGQQEVDWQSRTHFFALASQMMRRILVDHARARAAAKRPDGATRVSLDGVLATVDPRGCYLLMLDQALSEAQISTSGKPACWSCATSAASRLTKLRMRCRSHDRLWRES